MRIVKITLLYLFIIITENNSVNAQTKGYASIIPPSPQPISEFRILDTAKLTITYKVKLKNKNTKSDIRILQIGNKHSKKFSKLLYQGDSTYFSIIDKGVRNAPWFTKVVPPIEVYSNYKTKEHTVTYRLFGGKNVYVYKEPFPLIKWELIDEQKKILSYTCQKAIGRFRGRTYEAWFTPKIPIQEGPYKFTGLPGLILEISDLKKDYVFNCIGIEKSKQIVPIKYFKWSYVKVSRNKLRQTIKRACEYPVQYLMSQGIKLRVKNQKRDLKKNSVSFYYNPIELE